MVLSLYGGFGVDKKTNKLLKKETKLEDSLNMVLDENRNWTKRKGQAIKFAAADVTDSIFMNSDLNYTPGNPTYHNKPGRYFVTTTTPSYKVINQDGSQFVPHNFSGLTNGSLISEAEYMETLLFTHVENPQAVLKYDGGSIYRAGLPAPEVTAANPGSAYEFAFFYDYIDAQGNNILGPITYVQSALSSDVFTIPTLKDSGFYGGYVKITSGMQVLNSSNRTLTGVTSMSSDVSIGARFLFRDAGFSFTGPFVYVNPYTIGATSSSFLSLVVESFTATTVTFTAESFGSNEVSVAHGFGASSNVNHRVCIRAFSRAAGVGAYVESGFAGGETGLTHLDNSVASFVGTISTVPTDGISLAEIYDPSTSKLRPPQCKYLQVFGNQIVYGSVSGLWDFDNRFVKYNNDDIIIYSDTSEGDYGENISEINRQLIGDAYDGSITGLCRVKDSLVVLKSRSIYALDGILLPDEYSLRKIESNLIGCFSYKSIIQTEQVAIFQGNDGIYATNGFSIQSFGDDIEADIVPLNMMRAAIVVPMKGFVFYNSAKTFFYDYEHKEWFIWDALYAPSGVLIDNNGDLVLFDGTNCIKFVDDKNDFGNAFLGMIQLSFLHLKKPSLLKKLTGVRLFNFGTTSNITMVVLKDWKSPAVATSTIDYTGSPTSVHKTIAPVLGQSISIKLSNNTVNQNMLISGMDVEIELDQYKDKNVK